MAALFDGVDQEDRGVWVGGRVQTPLASPLNIIKYTSPSLARYNFSNAAVSLWLAIMSKEQCRGALLMCAL